MRYYAIVHSSMCYAQRIGFCGILHWVRLFVVVYDTDVSNTATLTAARRLSSASQPLYHHLFVPLSQQPGGELLQLSNLCAE